MGKDFEIQIPFESIEASTYSELLARIETEHRFWTTFEDSLDVRFYPPSRSSIAAQYRGKISSVIGGWGKYLSRLRDIDGRAFAVSFHEFSSDVEGDPDIPPNSKSRFGVLANHFYQTGQYQELYKLLIGHILNSAFPSGVVVNQNVDQGAFLGSADAAYTVARSLELENGAVELHKTEQDLDVIEILSEEVVQKVEEMKKFVHATQSEATQIRDELTDDFRSIHKRILASYSELMRTERAASKKRNDEYQALVAAFNFDMRIRRPVELWAERQSEHSRNSESAWRRFGIAAFFLLAFSGILALLGGDYVAASFVPDTCVVGFEETCSRISAKGPLLLSAILLLSTVWLWYLRLEMKVFLSERHLALDARERRAFAETYLSLLKGGDVSTEHEAVVLGSLFRPTQDGIIKDDGGPEIGVAGLMSKLLERK
ncbi:hypothetical protein K3729_16045 [Rhodobacteraceae bacterium S2214]|nr:hypothetical protein K3729_16045 [Rhodobacteraceae bacterium S2214]